MIKQEVPDIKIPQTAFDAIKEASDMQKRFSKDAAEMLSRIPKVELPKFDMTLSRDVVVHAPANPEIERERNAWKRHDQVLEVQKSLLNVQSKLLESQEANDEMSRKIYRITVIGVKIAVATVLISLIPYRDNFIKPLTSLFEYAFKMLRN